jgi:hypothetical protein
MTDRLDAVEARLAAIERRLAALEEGSVLGPHQEASDGASAVLGEESVSSAAAHLGRVLLIFGGAYLLRAITDFGFLPTLAGIPVGIAYAVLWLYMAWRIGARPHERVAAMLYGGVSVLLVLPILVEAVSRFELLTGASSAAALVAFCTAALCVACARDLKSLAWLTVAGGVATSFVLLRASGAAITFCCVALLLGVASYWIVHARRWRGLQWLGAIGADAAVVLLATLSASEHWSVAPAAGYGLAVFMWGAYLAGFALRSHVLGREPGIFEVFQTVLASLVVFGVTLWTGQDHPGWISLLGASALGFGAAAWALAFSPKTREARGQSFYFYSTLALALVIGGSAMLAPPKTAAAGWGLIAVALAWLSGKQERVSLSLHSAIALVAAGIGSGALADALVALTGAGGAGWPGLQATQLVVAACAVACLFIPVAQVSDRWGRFASLPQLIVLVLAVWVVGGQMVDIAAPLVAGAGGPSPDLGILAAVRTGVLSASAVVLALSSGYRRWPEARWLAYPVLVSVGVKLIFEDFPHGRPVTLFLALGLVGGALIAVSKLMRKRKARVPAPAGAGAAGG